MKTRHLIEYGANIDPSPSPSPSPSPPSPFLYPSLCPIVFLSPCFVLLSNCELCKGTIGFLKVPLGSLEFQRLLQGSIGPLFHKVPFGSLGFLRNI